MYENFKTAIKVLDNKKKMEILFMLLKYKELIDYCRTKRHCNNCIIREMKDIVRGEEFKIGCMSIVFPVYENYRQKYIEIICKEINIVEI